MWWLWKEPFCLLRVEALLGGLLCCFLGGLLLGCYLFAGLSFLGRRLLCSCGFLRWRGLLLRSSFLLRISLLLLRRLGLLGCSFLLCSRSRLLGFCFLFWCLLLGGELLLPGFYLGGFLLLLRLLLGCFLDLLFFGVDGFGVEFERTWCSFTLSLHKLSAGHTWSESLSDMWCQLVDICVEIGSDVFLDSPRGWTFLILQIGDGGYNHVDAWRMCWYGSLLGVGHAAINGWEESDVSYTSEFTEPLRVYELALLTRDNSYGLCGRQWNHRTENVVKRLLSTDEFCASWLS